MKNVTVQFIITTVLCLFPCWYGNSQSTGNADSFNGGFEEWQRLAQVPRGWQVKDGLFPAAWSVEGRPGATGAIERIENRADQQTLAGKYSLHLIHGRILSKNVVRSGPDFGEAEMEISVLARGQGGAFTLHLREYLDSDGGVADASIMDFATVMTEQTGVEWKQYTAYAKIRSRALRFDVEGDQVVFGDFKLRLIAKQDKLQKIFLAIPAAGRKPAIDGAFSPEEWSSAAGSKTGFMNINTGNAVSRQSEYYLTANDEKLFIACRIPVRSGGLKNTVTKRDGNVYEDESLELYINPTPGQESIPVVYHFIVNTAGVLFDMSEQLALGQSLIGWDCNGVKIAAGHQADPAVSNGYAVIELAIPLSEVGLKSETPFGINLCRNMYGPDENADITGGGYRDYKHMVTSVISKQTPAVVWGYEGDVKEGRLKLVAEITNPTSEPKNLETALLIGERSEKSRCELAPSASRRLIFDASSIPLKSSNLAVNVTDSQQQPFVFQNVHFNLEEASRALSATDASPSRVEFYPVQKKINIRLSNLAGRKKTAGGQGYGPTEVCIYRGDKLILRKTVAKPQLVENTGHITIPFDPPGEGTFQVKAVLHDQKDGVLETVSGTIEVTPLLWLNNNFGKDRIVIPPFIPLEVRKETVSCWGRDYEFDGSGLPVTLTSQSQNMLAEPMRFVLQDSTGTQEGRPGRKLSFNERAPDRVVFRGETRFPNLTIHLKGLMEYDGMVRYEMEIVPKTEVAVERLSLQIPMRAGRYFHWMGGMRLSHNGWLMNLPAEGEYRDPRVPVWTPQYSYADENSKGIPYALYLPRGDGLIWSSRGIVSANLYGNFLPAFTFGNTVYGLGWFADNDRGWIHDATNSCFELVRRGETTILNVNFVARPATLKEPRTIVFGIMATPVRPGVTAGDLALKLNCRGGSEYNFLKQHQGVVYREPYLAKRLRDANLANGYATALYIGTEFPINDPATKACWHEWAREPFGLYPYGREALLPFKIYGTDPDNYVSLEVCTCSSRIDYQIACLKDAMIQGLIDGIYLDNSYPNPCLNIQHERCGYVREDGKLQGGAHIFETRELLKRVAVLSYTHHCLAPRVTVHLTSALMTPLVSFADIYFDGEWGCEKSDFMDYFTQPYLEGFCAGAWGGNRGWLPMGNLSRSSLAALKLHDLWILWGGRDPTTARIEREFGVLENDCRFVGYWQKEAGTLTGLPACVKASYYLRPGKRALIYLANLTNEDKEVTPSMNFASRGIPNPEIIDAETEDDIRITKGTIKLSVGKHDFRVIRVDNVAGSRLGSQEETNPETDLLGFARKWGAGKEKMEASVLSVTGIDSFQGIAGRYLKLEFLNNGNGTEDYPVISRWFGPKKQGIDMRRYDKVKVRLYVTSDSPDVKERTMVLVFMNRPKEGEPLRQQCCPEAKTTVGRWVDYTWDISKFDRDSITSIVPHFYEGRGNNLSIKERYTWYVNDFKLVPGEGK